MYKPSFRAYLLVLVLMSPCAASAAGLGKLTINSALGQPLQAEIDLVAVDNEEIPSLAAQLGSHEAFQQAGIDYKSFFSAFDVSIEPRSNGDPFIKITSSNAINEPFLNMLIELSWASGRLMREYTVLLDPVESVISEPVAPVINHNSVALESRSDKPDASAPSSRQQTVAPKAADKAPVPDNQRKATYGPVTQGDTLSDIARQVSPAGVSLNQVLIAMFRANRDAFIEDNINLLKAGMVLRIPNQGEIAAIPEAEANQEVKVHVADWRGYRNSLVAAATESSEGEIIKQSDMGQITATMADDAVESNERPEEVLRLSSGAPLGDLSSPGDGNEMPQDRLRMMEEDATARNLALEEANERIAILEKNIQDLQRLLELKNPSLAEAQMQAENLLSPESAAPELIVEQESERTHDSDPALEPESIAVMADSSELFPDTGMNEAVDPELIVQTGTAEPFVSSDELSLTEDISLMDQLMKNTTYIGSAAAFLLLGTLAIVRIRRKKAEDELAADEMGIEASMALRERMASVKAADSLASHDEIAAGSVNPDDATVNDTLDAEQVYENQYQAETNAAIDDHADKTEADMGMSAAPDWQQESEDSSIQSDDEANIDLGDVADSNEQAAQSEQSDDDVEFDLDLDEPASSESDSEIASAASDQEEPGLDLDIDDGPVLEKPEISDLATNKPDNMLNLDSPEFDKNDVSEEAEEKAETETVAYEPDNDLPFDLDTPAGDDASEPAILDESAAAEQNDAMDLALDFPDVSEGTTQAEAEETEEMARDSDSSSENEDDALELELDSDSKFEPQSANSNLLSSDSSLSDLKSEMEIPALESEESTAPVAGEKDAYWHEVETKVDLARAYLDMEDKEGAREILEEIINEGDKQQKENAKAMLAEL